MAVDRDVTIFAIPKAFVGHADLIQRNAIGSWRGLGYDVMLMGKDDGVAEFAAQVGAKHVADIRCNEYGTPSLQSAFAMANDRASTAYLAYVNADIILTRRFPIRLPKSGRPALSCRLPA